MTPSAHSGGGLELFLSPILARASPASDPVPIQISFVNHGSHVCVLSPGRTLVEADGERWQLLQNVDVVRLDPKASFTTTTELKVPLGPFAGSLSRVRLRAIYPGPSDRHAPSSASGGAPECGGPITSEPQLIRIVRRESGLLLEPDRAEIDARALLERLGEAGAARREAFDQLRESGGSSEELVERLFALLNHDDLRIRLDAARFLAELAPSVRRIPKRIVARFREADEKKMQTAAFALDAMGAAARPAEGELRAVVRPSDFVRSGVACKVLGKIGGRENLAFLSENAAHPDLGLRRAALSGLASMGPAARPAAPAIWAALELADLQTSQAAAYALRAVVREGAEIWRELDLRLTDRRPHVRTAAAYAVAQFGAELPEAVPRLIELLERDPEPDPRAYAVVALGAIGPAARSALPALEAAAKSADMRIPGWAAQAIEKIRAKP